MSTLTQWVRARGIGGSVLLLYLILALTYLTLVPRLEGFDSIAHMNYANYLRGEVRLPIIDPDTVNYSYELATQPPAYFAAAALAAAWLPFDHADTWVRASENGYFPGKSRRWSVDLPAQPLSVTASIWLARLVTLLGGITAVVVSGRLVGFWFPGRPTLVAAVLAAMAFNPLFLFMSVIVSNDMWSLALAVTVLWLVATAPLAGPRATRLWLITGLVTGVALITKYSVFLAVFPALAILLARRRDGGWSGLLRAAALVAVGALVTGGFWYLRSWRIYGELIPLGAAGTVIQSLNRVDPLSGRELWTMAPWLLHSYWGVFVAILAPAALFKVTDLLVLLAVTGLAVAAVRRRLPPWRVLAPLLVWAGVFIAGVFYWTATVSYGEQARLGLAAAPAIATLLVLGWGGLLPARAHRALHLGVVVLFLLLALWPLPTLMAAYRTPPALRADFLPPRPLQAQTASGLTVRGFDLPAGGALVAGDTLPLTLYLGTTTAQAEDATLFVHLVDDGDRLLYQFDGVAYAGRHPTRQWQPGVTFADDHLLALTAPISTTTLAHLTVGFYPLDEPQARLGFVDGSGASLGDRLDLGPIRILAEPPQLAADDVAPAARWLDGIELLAWQLTAGADGTLTLRWRTTAALARDYTVFVQELDEVNGVRWQEDRQPQHGAAPTSTWLVDEVIDDVYAVPVPGPGRRLIVGLYDPATGARLRREDGTDFLELTRR